MWTVIKFNLGITSLAQVCLRPETPVMALRQHPHACLWRPDATGSIECRASAFLQDDASGSREGS
jgi:hypothetical protein